MKKKLFCVMLVFMLVLLSGCSDIYFSPARFVLDSDYAKRLVTNFAEEIVEEYEYISTPTIELNIGDMKYARDSFSGKVSENYTISVDSNGSLILYKYSKTRKGKYDLFNSEIVLTGHYICANYNDKAIAFCEETENGRYYLLSYEFETGDVRYHADLEELYSFFDLDKSKWFVCCKLYKDMLQYDDSFR